MKSVDVPKQTASLVVDRVNKLKITEAARMQKEEARRAAGAASPPLITEVQGMSITLGERLPSEAGENVHGSSEESEVHDVSESGT